MNVAVRIENLREMVKVLDQLPDKLQRQAILKVERKSTKPLIRAAKSKVKGSGKLASSIGNITAKSKNPIIYVGPRLKGGYKDKAYTARWVEYGTKGVVSKKSKSRGGFTRASDNPDFKWVGAIKKGGRFRADQPAKPFMNPAITQTQSQVADLFAKNLTKYLDNIVQKTVSKIKK